MRVPSKPSTIHPEPPHPRYRKDEFFGICGVIQWLGVGIMHVASSLK